MATHSPRSTTARSAAGRTRPGRPGGGTRRPPTRGPDRTRAHAAIPVSVWPPRRPVDPDAVWPEPTIERLVTTLTSAGDRVVLLAPDPAGQLPGPVYGTAARVVVPPGTLAAAAETVEAHHRRLHLATWPATTADGSGGARPYWARFVDPAPAPLRGGCGALDELEPMLDTPGQSVPHEAVGTTALVVAAVGPDGVSDAFGGTAAALLRPGGTLAVITHCDQ